MMAMNNAMEQSIVAINALVIVHISLVVDCVSLLNKYVPVQVIKKCVMEIVSQQIKPAPLQTVKMVTKNVMVSVYQKMNHVIQALHLMSVVMESKDNLKHVTWATATTMASKHLP